MQNEAKKRVFVGLSGGVDSSVSAALLKKAGFEVFGIFIKVWQPDVFLTGSCTWREDRLDAMRICAKLNIPFFTLDLQKEYKKKVVDYMLAEYKTGYTPNPDVMCNKYIKFGGFFDWAIKNGADYVATGHYARIMNTSAGYKLFAGKDRNKDQSYFLWALSQRQLSKTIFPIGNMKKPEVRKLAKKFSLLTATKKDSQGLCFIGKVDMVDFLKTFLKVKSGNVLNKKDEVIGRHQGAELYTIGQRYGFSIMAKTNADNKHFVIEKNISKNILIVADSVEVNKRVTIKTIMLKKVNWILGTPPDFKREYFARIRYKQPLGKCILEKHKTKKISVNFLKDPKFPAKGQSVVIYDGEVCLGGGIIE